MVFLQKQLKDEAKGQNCVETDPKSLQSVENPISSIVSTMQWEDWLKKAVLPIQST